MEGIEIANISIPLIKGDTGSAGKIKSISVVMLSPTATAYVTNSGTESEAILTLGIPQGASVASATVTNGDLIITLNNGQTLNAGRVKGTGVSNVTINQNYDFVVTLDDGTSITAGNLATEISSIISTALANYYTKTQVDTAISNLDTNVKANYAHTIILSMNTQTYELTMGIADYNGNVIDYGIVDLPLESMIVSGEYDETTKKIILTLESGSTIEFSVADLVDGLVSTTDYATDSKGGVFCTGNYVVLDTNHRLRQTVSFGLPQLRGTSYDEFLCSVQNAKNVLSAYKVTTIDPTASTADKNKFITSQGAVINYVASVIGDINSVLDAINGEEV